MINSTKYSYLFLRLGLAAVFLWFGIDKFLHPEYWLNAWVPPSIITFAGTIGISATQFIYLNGIFEVLIALGLVTGVFLQFFALLGGLFLISVIAFSGFNESTVRDLGLLGGFISIFLWPERQR